VVQFLLFVILARIDYVFITVIVYDRGGCAKLGNRYLGVVFRLVNAFVV
jgi:hypothetical protein